MNLSVLKNLTTHHVPTHMLLFLFPIMGAFARHWFSVFFLLISLTSIYGLFRAKITPVPLLKEEKVVIYGALLFFLAYLLPTVIHPFELNSLEVEIRYLLFIPIYLFIRRIDAPERWFFFGVIAGAISIFIYGMYELYFTSSPQRFRINGGYVYIFYGSVAVIIAFVALSAQYSLPRHLRWICVVAFALSVTSALLSGARSSYIMILLAAVTWVAVRYKLRNLILFLVVLSVLSVTIYKLSDTVNYQVSPAIENFTDYIAHDDPDYRSQLQTSESIRLELWQLSLLVIRDHFLLGIGRSNFDQIVRNYMNQAQLENRYLVMSHPHNAFLEVLVSKGLLGAVAFTMLFFYPLFTFVKDHRIFPSSALPGIMLVITHFAYSLFEIPFIKNNGTAVYLIFLAVILAYHSRQKHFQSSQ